MKPEHCDFCGFTGNLVFVHSHYQCPRCGINVAPCCQGEQCEYDSTESHTFENSGDNPPDPIQA